MIKGPSIFNDEASIPKDITIIDGFSSALKELFFIENPHLKSSMPDTKELLQTFLLSTSEKPLWVYYPWRNMVIKIPSEATYYKLRTSRNKNLLLLEEQNEYRNLKVGIAGLSVGSAIVHALTISGGPKSIKIADFDTLEITNLNRIKAKLTDIGLNKTEIAAREIWEVDPFADLELWDTGIKKDTIEKFIEGLDVFIDEMDSIDLKLLARFICKQKKIPVLMATDNGDGVIIDVERFDLEPDREIFHGLIPGITSTELENLNYKDWLKLATKIVGPEYLTERMQESIMQIGKTIPAVPQLGTSANMAGSAISYALRRIANKEAMPSGRYTINIEEFLDSTYNNPERKELRLQKKELFQKAFGV